MLREHIFDPRATIRRHRIAAVEPDVVTRQSTAEGSGGIGVDARIDKLITRSISHQRVVNVGITRAVTPAAASCRIRHRTAKVKPVRYLVEND